MANTGKELLNLVWSYGHEGYEHIVNSHINRLRAKIEYNLAQPLCVLSVKGIGYEFSDSADLDKGQHRVQKPSHQTGHRPARAVLADRRSVHPAGLQHAVISV